MTTQKARYQLAQRDTEALAISNLKKREMRWAGDTRRTVGKLEDGTQALEGGYSRRYLERFTSLASALTAFGSTSVHASLSKAITLTGNATVPANVFLDIRNGGSIALNGFTLTINGPFNAGVYQVFSGSGSVIFGAGQIIEAYPQWWGSKGDNATSGQDAYWQKAIDSLNASGAGTLLIPDGTYLWTVGSRVNLKSNVNIRGQGRKAIISVSGTHLNNTSLTQNEGYFDATTISNVEISGIRIKGNGSWTATPFACPVGAGNAVGFTNEDTGFLILTGCDNIRIHHCFFDGLQQAIRVGGSSTNTDIFWDDNVCENIGTGNYFQLINGGSASRNRISGVYGNMTDDGDTSTASSKFADGIYIYITENFVCSDNVIDDVCRIGIVLEGDGVTKCKNIVVANNTIWNLHDAKGTEYNAGIWAEGGKAEEPVTLEGNTIYGSYGSRGLGIQAQGVSIKGGSVRGCALTGLSLYGAVKAVGVTVEDNYRGAQIDHSNNPTQTTSIRDCIFKANQRGGILVYRSTGQIDISNNLFEDNGGSWSTVTDGLGGNHAIRLERMYTAQYVIIQGNTFISSANAAATTGQLYGIEAVDGGDFAYRMDGILNNYFLFRGTLSSYPASLDAVPVSFASNNGAAVTPHDICGWCGNQNSKMPVPDLDGTATSGYARFMGFANSAPVGGTYRAGDYFLRKNMAANQGWLLVCIADGTPGTWEERGWGDTKRTGSLTLTVGSFIAKAGAIVAEATGLIRSLGVGIVGDANFESLDLFHNGASNAVIRANKGGTGTYRDIIFQTNGSTHVTLQANTQKVIVETGNIRVKSGAIIVEGTGLLRGYGVGTDGATDFESVDLFHNGASNAVLRVNKGGTGTYRSLLIQTSGATAVTIDAGGKTTTKASASANAGFNLPHGAAPSAPADGDMWSTTAGAFIRINGVTKTFTLT